MGKKAFMNKLRDGKQKEVTVAGERFLIKSPELKNYGEIGEFSNQVQEGKKLDFSIIVKMVIDNTFNVETGELYFNKGDFEALQGDRNGAVNTLSEEIIKLMAPTEKEQEETKKK